MKAIQDIKNILVNEYFLQVSVSQQKTQNTRKQQKPKEIYFLMVKFSHNNKIIITEVLNSIIIQIQAQNCAKSDRKKEIQIWERNYNFCSPNNHSFGNRNDLWMKMSMRLSNFTHRNNLK